MDHQFRSAAFGGFHKEDVLNYLEKLVQEHNAAIQLLQKQLEEAREECSRLTQAEEEHSQQLCALRQEQQQLTQSNQQLEQQLALSQSQNSQLTAQLTQAQEQCKLLQGQVDKLAPDAEAYLAVKERTAGVELQAHRRAQNVLDQAHAQAQNLHSQTEQWLARVNREYQQLRGQTEKSIANAKVELESVGQTLEMIAQRFTEQDAALERLSQVYSCQGPEKVPAPMPIPEE